MKVVIYCLHKLHAKYNEINKNNTRNMVTTQARSTNLLFRPYKDDYLRIKKGKQL